jgi:hypothetical protein
MQGMYYIGLDIHKRKISYCVKARGRVPADAGVTFSRDVLTSASLDRQNN